MADGPRQLGMGLSDSLHLSLDSVFTFVEWSQVLTMWHLDLNATFPTLIALGATSLAGK